MTYASALTLGFIGLSATGILSAQNYPSPNNRLLYGSNPAAYSGGQNADEAYRSCMEGAVRQREEGMMRVYEEYYRVHLTLVQERSRAMIGVWSIANASERSRAESDVERGYREARRENDDMLREAEREMNRRHNELSRECRRQQQEMQRQISEAQREHDRLRREQERAARDQEAERLRLTQADRRSFDNDRRLPDLPAYPPDIKVYDGQTSVRGYYDAQTYPASSRAPFTYTRPTYAPSAGTTVDSSVTARSVNTRTVTHGPAGQSRPAFTYDPYYYDPSMGNWRVPANERFDASLSRNTQPFGPMPQGVCGTPWTTPGLGLAGDNLPLAACIW